MTVKLLTEHHLEFLSFQRDCTGLSDFTLVKIPYCWKSHVTAQMYLESSVDQHCVGARIYLGLAGDNILSRSQLIFHEILFPSIFIWLCFSMSYYSDHLCTGGAFVKTLCILLCM